MANKKWKKKIDDFMFDHENVKNAAEIIKSMLACVVAAAIYAFGYRCFILNTNISDRLVSGGMSGFSQTIVQLFELFGVLEPEKITTWQPIFNYLLNIPMFIIGWKYIGKRFSILTLFTVLLISLFTSFMPQSILNLFESIQEQLLPRALFAGICTGIATVIAFKNCSSTGGLDVVSLAVANKKSTSIGKYLVTFNGIVLIGYTLTSYLYFVKNGGENRALVLFLYSAIYLFTNALVNDFLNSRYRKAQVQIITTNENISNILIANFPHGCTIVNGKGAFSKENRFIIYMVVSSSEVQKVVQLVQVVDPHAFVNVTTLNQVYGRFYIEPFK